MNARHQYAHERHISPTKELKKRGRHVSNAYIFDSPKNNSRLSFLGDVAFLCVIHLESLVEVKQYILESPTVHVNTDGEDVETTFDARVIYANGKEEWWEFKRSVNAGPQRQGREKAQLSAQSTAASLAGVQYRLVTEKFFVGKEYRFDNWLHLCCAITRTRGYSKATEILALHDALRVNAQVTLGSLFSLDVDPALMFGLVASEIQKGLLQCDLDTQLLSLGSVIKPNTDLAVL